MRALRSEKRASRANPHPNPSPVGEGRRHVHHPVACGASVEEQSFFSFSSPARLPRRPRPRRAAGRSDEGPGAGNARARALGRIALPRLPERVDRRFRGAAGARHPHPHSRAHRQGRKQRCRARLSRLALRRFHSLEAPVQAGDAALVAEPRAHARPWRRGGSIRPPPRAPRNAELERRRRKRGSRR